MERLLFKDLKVGRNYRLTSDMIDIVFTVLCPGANPVVVAQSLVERRSPGDEEYDHDHDMVSHGNPRTIQLIGWLRHDGTLRTSQDPFRVFLSDEEVKNTSGHLLIAAVATDGDTELPGVFKLLDVTIVPFQPASESS